MQNVAHISIQLTSVKWPLGAKFKFSFQTVYSEPLEGLDRTAFFHSSSFYYLATLSNSAVVQTFTTSTCGCLSKSLIKQIIHPKQCQIGKVISLSPSDGVLSNPYNFLCNLELIGNNMYGALGTQCGLLMYGFCKWMR